MTTILLFHHCNSYSLLKDVLEDVFESAVVGLEDGVLGAHVEGPLLANGILEAAVCEACDRLGERWRESTSAVSLYQQRGRCQKSPVMTAGVVKSNRLLLLGQTDLWQRSY